MKIGIDLGTANVLVYVQGKGIVITQPTVVTVSNDNRIVAVVGPQPFGGARGSGTNDKAGSKLNLVRWISPRAIKETFSPPTDYRYPFMAEE